MTVPARINLVTLGVADVEAAAAFYERLGWRRSSASVPGGVAFFALGGAVLGLFGSADLAADARLPYADPPAFRGQSLAINLPNEAEVDAAITAAVAAGGTLLKAAERADWGGWSGYFADPDGHAWEVAYNPGWPLDGDGRVLLPD
jgi:catechol 2,3-dioxygenase-like lactoylglutathione lyase family enzyme